MRKWTEWNGARHWDCTVVVSYNGVVQNIPEGATGVGGVQVKDFPQSALREQLRLNSGGL